ncbi:hypothetical protein GRI97_08055 [Altererythrobacter xixiisoli]|uniref:Uncharacterized protein n=1 Tax=Croceibacterium xixiisoli TaxID=1476466 RepID=A0A6I4TUJ6_9SPHN|nr:hypothetical protein [Croceibacterium xixiisoli]MXO98939.1 hypothetical protein [Croceibacterium xixiisoli]
MSFAQRSIVQGPLTVAPPSFDGHGWLVAINMAWMTAGFLLFTMLAIYLARKMWQRRHCERLIDPIGVWRAIGLLLGAAGSMRFGAEALVIWGWNPMDPQTSALIITVKRFVDPLAATLGMAAIGLYFLAERGMSEQLRKRPHPIHFWRSKDRLRQPALLVISTIIAAICVVSLR